jgi:parvulin-like peptidyl-prolyl isomerase
MNHYFTAFFSLFCFLNVWSQNISEINSLEAAENFIKSNPKTEIATLEITTDSLDFYKTRFLNSDLKDKNRIVKIESFVAMRVSYVYLDGSKLSMDEIDTKRKEIIKLHKKGKSFGEIATEYTMDSSKATNGDLGWFNESEMHKTFENAIKNHKKNDLFTVDILENKWYYVVLKTFNDLPKSRLYILSLLE